MRKELYENLKRILIQGMMGMKSLLEHEDPFETYIPPSKEEAINCYNIDPTLNRCVDTMLAEIIFALEPKSPEPIVEADLKCNRCGQITSAPYADGDECVLCGGTFQAA